MNQQEIRLVNQYLDIVGEEMDVIAWSTPLSELPLRSESVVSCLLRGTFLPAQDRWRPPNNGQAAWILREFNLKLTAAGAQPTTSILRVIDWVWPNSSFVAGFEIQNAWLSLYYHNHTYTPHTSAIPVVWSSSCTSIASKRLDLYDRGVVTPEIGLVIFFLSSQSASIACQALRWYLRLEGNALRCGDDQYFVSFPIIFRKGLSTSEKRESWLLLVKSLVRNWDDTPLEWKLHFIETFFRYENPQVNNQATMHDSASCARIDDKEKVHPHVETQAGITRTDGLGWLKDVWVTVLRPMVPNVCIPHIEPQWFDQLGIIHAVYPQSTETDHETSPPESSAHAAPIGVSDVVAQAEGSLPKSVEEHLEDSAQRLLEVLATLLETGATSMPRTLCDRLRDSYLLKDERSSHDADSLRRIKTVLNCSQEC